MADSPQVDSASDDEELEGDEKFLSLARSRFQLAADAEKDVRTEALDDLKFLSGEQWPDEMKRDRELDSRPCLVVNLLPPKVRQLTNEQRQNRPAIKVDPVGDGADEESAKIRQGLIRHIEYKSNADLAYDTAYEAAVRASFGYFRMVTDYCDPMSFDQELLIKRIPNAFKVYKDPSSRDPDGADANFYFIIEDLIEDEFKEQYPKAEKHSAEEFKSIGDNSPIWRTARTIRVAEYLYKEFKEVEIALLSDANGTVVEVKDLEVSQSGQVSYQGQPVQILKRRKTKKPVVMWAKITGLEVLEKQETVFDLWIPVFPVIGEELDVDGKIILKGLVRDAKDPQRMVNFWKSCEAETIALAPRTPWVAAEGQIEGYEDVWETAHSKNHSVLPYVPFSLDGTPCPPPQRQTFEPPVQAVTMAGREAQEDLKGVTGIFDATMGARSNETSGKAINARNNQAQTSNFHFTDNLNRTIRHAGRVAVRAIPKVYDTARIERIIREDGTREMVKLNQPFEKNGKPVTYDLSTGEYDAVIDTGPAFATKRQEGAAAMQDLAKAIPAIGQVAPDLMVKATDTPYSDEIAERLKKSLPPGLTDETDPNQQIPPQVKAELDKNSKMIEALSKANNALHNERDQKTLELESRERIEMAKLKTQTEIALAQMGSKESMALLEHQVGEIMHRLDLLHSSVPIGAEDQFQEAGPTGAAPPESPTGGPPPGQSMESP